MNIKNIFRIFEFSLLVSAIWSVSETTQDMWDLQRCINHALQNNVTIAKLRIDSLRSQAYYREARAARFPSVNADAGYSLTRDKANSLEINAGNGNTEQTARYSIGASWTIFKGGRIRTTVKQKKIEKKQKGAAINEAETDIVMNVVQAYLQVLFARESVKNARQSLEASEAQFERTVQLYEAGSASSVSVAQMKAQFAMDKYNLVVAQSSLERRLFELKQLLEIPVDESFKPYFPSFSNSLSLTPLPDRNKLYTRALQVMPEIENGELLMEIAELEIKKAVTGYIPSVILSTSIATNHSIGSKETLSNQLGDNYNPSLGLQLSVPILDSRTTKTAVENAELCVKTARLNADEAKRSLLYEIEAAYQDAMAARSRLEASAEQLEAARQSYDLAQEQYKLGMINANDLLVEKNAFLSARHEHLQSKYSALLFSEMIDVYIGEPIELPQGI